MTTKKIEEKLDNLESLIKNLKNTDSDSITLKKTALQIGNMIVKITSAITSIIKLIHLLF